MLGIGVNQSEGAYTLAIGVPAGVVGGAIVGWMVPTGKWHEVYRAQ